MASRSRIAPLRWFGGIYTSMVRGVPDIIFFLFVPIALDQGFEWVRHQVLCDSDAPVRQGNDFVVCAAAKLPLNDAAPWVHDVYGIFLAVIAFSIVFGAFAANVLSGAMAAVPRAQLETAEAYGMSPAQVNRRVLIPQMWTYALPGLSNLWMILIKATPLLFLLGVEDIVYWARELGGSKTSAFTYPHPDWRCRSASSSRRGWRSPRPVPTPGCASPRTPSSSSSAAVPCSSSSSSPMNRWCCCRGPASTSWG